jgi:hypothetical protein
MTIIIVKNSVSDMDFTVLFILLLLLSSDYPFPSAGAWISKLIVEVVPRAELL